MYQVYILKSTRTGRTYTGYSKNVSQRIKRHNYGDIQSTRAGRPWVLVHKENCKTITEARRQEQYYKSGLGRKKITRIYKDF